MKPLRACHPLALSAVVVFALALGACSSAGAEGDDAEEATGAATTDAIAEGKSCSRISGPECAIGLKCIDSKCAKECGRHALCDYRSYCIPDSSYSSTGVCRREGADEDDPCFDESCKSGLKCDSGKCVQECSRYSSYCGTRTCIPDSAYSSTGTCKSSKSSVGGPCFDDDSCSYGQKCESGTCRLR